MALDRAALGSVDPHRVLSTAYAAVSAMQDQPPKYQVQAITVLFLAACDELGLDVGQALLTRAEN